MKVKMKMLYADVCVTLKDESTGCFFADVVVVKTKLGRSKKEAVERILDEAQTMVLEGRDNENIVYISSSIVDEKELVDAYFMPDEYFFKHSELVVDEEG